MPPPQDILLLPTGSRAMDLFPLSLTAPFRFPTNHAIGGLASWPQIVETLANLKHRRPSLAVIDYREASFFRQGTGWLPGLAAAAQAAIFRPSSLGELLVFASLVRQKVPIALINRSDAGEIPPASDWYYRRCHACFVRELSSQPELNLRGLFTLSGGNPETNRRSRKILFLLDPHCPKGRDPSKLRPISLGMPDEWVHEIPAGKEKKWDVFFAGDLNGKSLRGRLVDEIRTWAGRTGHRLLLRDSLPRREYLEFMAASRLTLSPPGMGWDCWRHYEAMMAESVPLMTYPTILQHRPGIEGEHCFYFAPEPGGLTRCLEKALASPERLPNMAAAGRRLVLEHHLFSKLRDYVIRETLDAASRPK